MSAIKDYLQSNSDWEPNFDGSEFTHNNVGQESFFIIETNDENYLSVVSRETGENAEGTTRVQITEVTDIPLYISREASLDIANGIDSELNGNNSDLEYPHSEGESSSNDNDSQIS